MTAFNPHFFDAQEAFEHAIRIGKLSADVNAPNYAGRFMYMHSEFDSIGHRWDAFKHADTRKYLRVPFPMIRESVA